jgi:hypothetical protein
MPSLSEYRQKHASYYADASLDDVANDVFSRSKKLQSKYKDRDSWLKESGLGAELEAERPAQTQEGGGYEIMRGLGAVAEGLRPDRLAVGVADTLMIDQRHLPGIAIQGSCVPQNKPWPCRGIFFCQRGCPQTAHGTCTQHVPAVLRINCFGCRMYWLRHDDSIGSKFVIVPIRG